MPSLASLVAHGCSLIILRFSFFEHNALFAGRTLCIMFGDFIVRLRFLSFNYDFFMVLVRNDPYFIDQNLVD